MLPDGPLLIEQKLIESAKIKKLKCDISRNFQTLCSTKISQELCEEGHCCFAQNGMQLTLRNVAFMPRSGIQFKPN